MKNKSVVLFVLFTLIVTACGGGEEKKESASSESFKAKVAAKLGLTEFEFENGVGPIKEKLNIPAEIDKKMAAEGLKIFESKCMSCHKLDEKYTGPALRDVTKRRTNEYIMNMILNPEEMTKRHPEARKLLGIHATQMTFQNVTQEDTRKLLEYLRSESK
ncbi:MAG: cytochrome C [Ignavibacteriales bacterium CG_4_9_14_3_um_filter_34_10]|nr:MAG: cytochrome C [Ignavibacteriales bacterium CG_4_9_14_3_um_filter_34_10]